MRSWLACNQSMAHILTLIFFKVEDFSRYAFQTIRFKGSKQKDKHFYSLGEKNH